MPPTHDRLSKFDLTGKTALITGAAGLLGVEHAAALLESGATVILTDIDGAALQAAQSQLARRAVPSRIATRTMDVTKPEVVREVARWSSEAGRRVDILLNNAAVDPKVGAGRDVVDTSRFEHLSIEQWQLQVDVGLTGAFLCSQAFGGAMAGDGQGGVILNIASDLSVLAPDQRLYRQDDVPEERQPVKPVTYSVVKTGLIGLTRYLATYWAHRGVRVNALSPGGVFVDQDDVFVERLTSLIPLGRMARRDDYRSAVQFLCSDAAAYMTGQNIVMDGGRSVW
jgi:NAD(P)-dependent dehydrogenase (short-subunit alcohol dehydrogenase family)